MIPGVTPSQLASAVAGLLPFALSPPPKGADGTNAMPPSSSPPSGGRPIDPGDVEARAIAYLATIPGAVQGEHGSDKTLWAARVLVTGYQFDEATAVRILRDHYNPRCTPLWSDRELIRKVQQAVIKPSGKRAGWLLDEPPPTRRSSTDQPNPPVGERPRRLANFIWDEKKDGDTTRRYKRPRSIQSIAADLEAMTGGWPKRVGRQLFVIDHQTGQPVILKKSEHADLFAWIDLELTRGQPGDQCAIEWVGEGPPKKEFFAGLSQVAEHFDRLELYPHEPPLPRHYYHHPETTGGDGRAVSELARWFGPATVEDNDLILSFLMTLVWGGLTGQRPMFLFEAADNSPDAGRGVGKTSTVQRAVDLVGGYFALSDTEKFTEFKTRLLTPEVTQRVILIDNLKSFKFSWSDLEAFLTSDTVSGRQLFVGEGRRPNHFTVAITVNQPGLSKDLAKRAIPIRLEKTQMRKGWEEELRALVESKRWEIIGDLIAMLRSPEREATKHLRWTHWQEKVLNRAGDPDALVEIIKARQLEIDADQDEAELIRAEIIAAIQNSHRDVPDVEAVAASITARQLATIVAAATGEKRPVNSCTRYVNALGVEGLRSSRTGKVRGWVWSGRKASPNAKPVDLTRIPE